MPEQDSKTYKVLDWIILSLFIIFILSLSNSIFINQIGYFGALLFILVKIFLTRKNQFQKTGLELAFALYMIAEILSLIFSDYKAEALTHFYKRALLIPVFYTTVTVTDSFKRGKNFFNIFVAASLITCLVYLAVSVKYYLNNQYVITQSGPDLVQNPITTSEIISFTVLFLFAFIINEKTNLKIKLLLYSGFAISLLTLIATYKRTGWMGVGFGIVLLLIIKKKWQILIPLVILGVILLVTEKNISQVDIYNFQNSGVSKILSFNTAGRAWNIAPSNDNFVVSDYENGLLFYKDSALIKRYETPGPVISFHQIRENLFLAQLIDTRFLILRKEGEEIKQVNEILSPGETKSYAVIDEHLYTLDIDSGLTFYNKIETTVKPIRFPQFKDCKWFFIDSSYFFFMSVRTGVTVCLNDGLLPGKELINKKMGEIGTAWLFNKKLVLGTKDGLKLFTVDQNDLRLDDNLKQLSSVYRIYSDGDILAVLLSNGTIYKMKVSAGSKFEILAEDKLSPPPTNFNFFNNKLYCTYVNRGRLLSFFDPYLQQNFTRLALWRAGWKMFLDHPLFGVGDIDLAKYYVKYKRPYDKEIHGHLHNNYFHFLATLGLFGFLALIYLFFKIFKKLGGIYSATKGKPFIASYSLGAIAAFASILVSGLSEQNFWDQEITTLIYFTIGLNVALFIQDKKTAYLLKKKVIKLIYF
ncbi:MAG: O-antigen ligase family protein [Psychromonas sp.]|nr:O-antigen ligase family protein [Psychromonas sp.]